MLYGMKTYSQDLRDKMLAALDRGMPRKEAVGTFGASPATLKRWLRRRRETGSVVPKRRLGMRLRIGASAFPNAAPYGASSRSTRRRRWRSTASFGSTSGVCGCRSPP